MTANQEMILNVFGKYSVKDVKAFVIDTLENKELLTMDKLAGALYGAWSIAQTLAKKEELSPKG